METLFLITLVVCALFLLGFAKLFPSARSRLPPGSMGWPYIGETLQLYSQDPNAFFSSKVQKYGAIFKMHVLGCPSVVVSSPEMVKMVLVSNAHLFKPTFPMTKERIMGKHSVFFHQGEYHFRLRKILLRSLKGESIKPLVSHVESIALASLKALEGKKKITAFHEMKNYSFNVILLVIFGQEEIMQLEDIKRCYYTLEKGYNSMPANIPGTLFHGAMKARRELVGIVARIISRRRQSNQNSNTHRDFLGSLMEDSTLTDGQISDNVIGLIFAGRDTTASVLTWVIKFLAENPKILQAVTEEQEEIMKGKQGGGLNWEDTKRMVVTDRVVQETLRVASVLSFTFREAVQDVELDGYLIPKGWKVLPLFRNIHHSPDCYPEPHKFHPWRFETSPKPNTFLGFGNGIHACPGNELAKLEMFIIIHYLTTKYRWCLMEEKGGIEYGPFALPRDGLPIQIVVKE